MNKNIFGSIAISMCFLGCMESSRKFKNNNLEKETIDEGITSAFYNNSNSRIAISTTKGNLILTDCLLNVISKIKADSNRVYSAFFSDNDKYIITGGTEGLIKIWATGKLSFYKTYNFGFKSFTSVYGNSILGGCGEKGHVVMYNWARKDTIRTILEINGAYHLYFIYTDSLLAISSGKSGYEFDLIQKKVIRTYSGHKANVYCIMPNNKKTNVVTASADSIVRVFDRKNGNLLHNSKTLNGEVFVACYSPGDKEVVASTSSGSIYFLDPTLSAINRVISVFSGRVNTIHFSNDGKFLVAGSELGGAKLISIESGKVIRELKY